MSRAIIHLLDSCIYTKGPTTYIDFFPFFSASGQGSEINILKVMAAMSGQLY